MRILTWNVNSIRSRLDRLLGVLARHRPDVVCLQELKCTAEQFPTEAIAEAGYRAAVAGQKTYNGVAILARAEPADVQIGLGDAALDAQARILGATVAGVRVYSVYVPNGQTVGGEAFDFKLRWLAGLRDTLAARHSPTEPLLVCGDTNTVRDDLDARNPADWADTVLCAPQVREAFAALLDWGLADVLREKHPGGGIFSWWDYRNLGFPRDDGLRLDHILATAPLAATCAAASVDRDERKANPPDLPARDAKASPPAKPSDHAPVLAEFA